LIAFWPRLLVRSNTDNGEELSWANIGRGGWRRHVSTLN
jgi:hypothetical protein